MRKHEEAFQRKKGKWNWLLVSFELIDGAKLFNTKPFQIPQSLYKTLKKEIEKLVDEGALGPIKALEWACLTFAIPKKDKMICMVSDLWGINQLIKRKPYPVLLIQDIMPSIGKFRFTTAIDLVMGYYSMGLAPAAKEKCVICLPWGIYQYEVLPMELVVSSQMFSNKQWGT